MISATFISTERCCFSYERDRTAGLIRNELIKSSTTEGQCVCMLGGRKCSGTGRVSGGEKGGLHNTIKSPWIKDRLVLTRIKERLNCNDSLRVHVCSGIVVNYCSSPQTAISLVGKCHS